MKYYFLKALMIFSFGSAVYGQEAKQMHETARTFMKQGDYANSILVLSKAMELEPSNAALIKDLALSYYFKNDYSKALEIIDPLLEKDGADDQSFQIAGNVYRAMGKPKEAERTYRKGIKKHSESGPLYNDLGEVMWSQHDFEAIKEWEKGIEKDPSFSKNYYNAARYYFLSTDKLWSIIYGEIFLNMEPLSNKSPEVKDMLLESYKKLFTETSLDKGKSYNRFESAFLQTMYKQAPVISLGIDAVSLTMLRTRFILDWFSEPKRPPFRLFEYHRNLLQEGLFEAYNQWLFGSSQNLLAFQNWINAHPDEYAAFTAFQKSRVFRLPAGEYYQK